MGLTDEGIRGFSDLKTGDMAALRTTVGQLGTWSQFCVGYCDQHRGNLTGTRSYNWIMGLSRSCMPCPRRCGSLPMPASSQPSTTVATWTTGTPKTTWPTRRRSVNWHRDTPGLRFWRMTKSTDADRQQPGSDGGRILSTGAQCCWRRRRRHQRASSREEGGQAAESDPAAKKCAYNTTTESVLTDGGVTWNTCVLCAGEHVSWVAGRAHSCISRVLVVVKTSHFTATRWAERSLPCNPLHHWSNKSLESRGTSVV